MKPDARPVPVMLMIRELGIGGSERQMSVVARSLDRSRFEPHVGCFRPDGLRRKELDEAGVPVAQFHVTSFKSPGVITGAIALGRYIRRHGIRLVHSFDLPTCLFTIPALAVFRSAIPVSSQRSHRELLSSGERRLLRITDKLTRAVVVNSQQLRRHVIEDERVAPERVLLCYNGIDLEIFRPPVENCARQPELAGAPLVIGVVCALRPEKDLGTLVRAFALVRGKRPGAKLAIVGDGPCKEELQKLAAELGIGGDVVFVPATRTVVPWLHSIDIFVLPSTSEALSNSLMEAMACGCAVVASKVGGNPELVEHEVTGLLFSSRQPDDLAGCLGRLMDSPELRRRFGQAATGFIHNQFSISASAARMGEIYEQLLASS